MSGNTDRDPCTRCAIKHLGQARALMLEVPKGYPEHVWYAMGHMAEAEDELVALQPDEAELIRRERLHIQSSLDTGDKGAVYMPEFVLLMHATAIGGMLPEAMHLSDGMTRDL